MAKKVTQNRFICNKCGKTKNRSSFYKCKNKVHGLETYCKKCHDKRCKKNKRIRTGWTQRRNKTAPYSKMKREDPQKYIDIMTDRRIKKEERIITKIIDNDGILARSIKKRNLVDAEKVYGAMEEYFDTTKMTTRDISDKERKALPNPTINGLANALGVRATEIKTYSDPSYQVGSDANQAIIVRLIVAAMQFIGDNAEQNLLSGNSTGASKILEAVQPEIWKDKEQGGGGLEKEISLRSQEQLLKILQTRKPKVIDAEAS